MESQLTQAESQLQHLISFWRDNPADYFKKRLKMEKSWDGELAILEAIPMAIQKKMGLVVSSGHALGKDYIGGGLVPYFLEVWGPCIVITTAPTGRQVKDVMWREVENHYSRIEDNPPGELLTMQIKISPKHYALGFTTRETGKMVGKFQGFHAARVFVIASEAQAITDAMYEQIDSILTADTSLLIQIGNPLSTTGFFANSIRNKKRKNIVIEMDCRDNPNYIEKKQMVPGLCSYDWVQDKLDRWGLDDPRFIARVAGKLPKTAIDSVFSHDLVDKMIDRETMEINIYRGVATDVGHFGDDESVIYGGTNGKIEKSMMYAGEQTDVTAGRALIVNNAIKGNFIAVDCDGLGVGTADTLTSMNLKGVNIVRIHSNGKSSDPQYGNFRAQMWMTVLEQARAGNASVPNDPILHEELTEVKYFVKGGKIWIEDKKDIKERLGRSCNRADAWIYYQYHVFKAQMINTERYSTESRGLNGAVVSSVAGRGGMAA